MVAESLLLKHHQLVDKFSGINKSVGQVSGTSDASKTQSGLIVNRSKQRSRALLIGLPTPFVSGFRPHAPPAAHREDFCDRLARSIMAGCLLAPGNAVAMGPNEYLPPPQRFFLTFSLLDVP
jgi:hypothetical protein